jgi:hypothetical protein
VSVRKRTLFELTVPPQYQDTEIGKLAEELKKEGISYRYETKLTLEQFNEFCDKTERLMMLIDTSLGITPIKASWN